jgi:hypothetical protein
MTANQLKYECAACGEMFAKTYEHMSHYMEKHDEGYMPRGQRRLRKVACRSCVKEMPVPDLDAGEWWRCECGYELPRF